DHPGGELYNRGNAGMNVVRDVYGDVAITLNEHGRAGGGHRGLGVSLACQLESGGGVDTNQVERVVFVSSTAGIGIDLDINQGVDVIDAVADDDRCVATGRSDHPAANDQEAVLIARNEPLDHHAAALVYRNRVGR